MFLRVAETSVVRIRLINKSFLRRLDVGHSCHNHRSFEGFPESFFVDKSLTQAIQFQQ